MFACFMAALPTTPKFMDYDAVYLPLNPFMKAETMATTDYINLFFPFKKPDFYKDNHTMRWNVTNDREMIALMMTLDYNPEAVNMSFLPDYAERYYWLLEQFKQWAFTLLSSYLYYNDYTDSEEDKQDRRLIQKGISAFECAALTYRIVLDVKPVIVWGFHSLLLAVKMMLSFMMTDEEKPIRFCGRCGEVGFGAGGCSCEVVE